MQKHSAEILKTTFLRFIIAVIFSIAFAYIESAVVVYLREIFYPNGFTFPLKIFSVDPVWKRLLITEIGREAATIVLIFTGAYLFGRNVRQRFAYFMIIFALWDIFYYVWLKVFLDWPASVMDWDILFLIPVSWAGPVIAPVMVSLILLCFSVLILYFDCFDIVIKTNLFDWFAFIFAGLVIMVSFCIPGPHIGQDDFCSYFNWYLFAAGLLLAIGVFAKCLIKSL